MVDICTTAPGKFLGTVPGMVPGTVPEATPGTVPRTAPGTIPGTDAGRFSGEEVTIGTTPADGAPSSDDDGEDMKSDDDPGRSASPAVCGGGGAFFAAIETEGPLAEEALPRVAGRVRRSRRVGPEPAVPPATLLDATASGFVVRLVLARACNNIKQQELCTRRGGWGGCQEGGGMMSLERFCKMIVAGGKGSRIPVEWS